ncbi:MAG: hypothetical protein IT555_20855, partial [Acetobacteraceae bacterium]|nr:hypothetical protein [Acetobacteraceae bacterium]
MTPAPTLASALDGILAALCALVWGRFAAFGTLAAPLHNRLNRARQRLARLLANLAAGRRPRPRAPRPGRGGGAPSVRLPRG